MAAVQLQDPFGGIVEEVAVMGDGDHGARIALQKLLQPVDRFGVQVVGWLVEQQHVGFGQQQRAKRHAAFFTARQNADLRVPRWQAQCVGGNFQLVLGISARGCNDRLQARLLCGQCIEVGIGFAIGGVDGL